MKKFLSGIFVAVALCVSSQFVNAQTVMLNQPNINSTCAELQEMITEAQWGIQFTNSCLSNTSTDLNTEKSTLFNLETQLLLAQANGVYSIIPQLEAAIQNSKNKINHLNMMIQYYLNMREYYTQLLFSAQNFFNAKGC